MHPFDIRKYEKIYRELVAEKIITPQDVFVPDPLEDQNILLVQTQ